MSSQPVTRSWIDNRLTLLASAATSILSEIGYLQGVLRHEPRQTADQAARPPGFSPVAQSEAQAVRVGDGSAEVPVGGLGVRHAGQADQFVTLSGAGEGSASPIDPAPAADAKPYTGNPPHVLDQGYVQRGGPLKQASLPLEEAGPKHRRKYGPLGRIKSTAAEANAVISAYERSAGDCRQIARELNIGAGKPAGYIRTARELGDTRVLRADARRISQGLHLPGRKQWRGKSANAATSGVSH